MKLTRIKGVIYIDGKSIETVPCPRCKERPTYHARRGHVTTWVHFYGCPCAVETTAHCILDLTDEIKLIEEWNDLCNT